MNLPSVAEMELPQLAEIWASRWTVQVPLGRLSYEPRAAWTCPRAGCGRGYIGTKDGNIYALPSASEVLGAPLRTGIPGGVYAMAGCPVHPEGELLVGTGSGEVLSFEARRGRALQQTGAWKVGDSVVRAVQRVGGKHSGRMLAITNQEGLRWIHAGETSQDSFPIPGSPRWLVRKGRFLGTSADSHGVWYVVTREGQLAQIQLPEGNGTLDIRHIGRLREFPNCLAVDRPQGRLRALVYGTASGLRVATIDAHGVGVDRLVRAGAPIRHLRLATLFGTEHVIACDGGGSVWVRPWVHPEESSEAGWFAWPELGSEVLTLQFRPSKGADEPFQEAFAALRDERIVGLGLYNRVLVREALRAKGLGSRTPAEDCTDAVRAAELSASASLPGLERTKELVAEGGQGTLDMACARLRRSPLLNAREVMELGVEILLAAARHGGDAEVLRCARQLHTQTLTWLRDLMVPGAQDGQEHRKRLDRWILFLSKHYLDGLSFGEKSLRLGQLVAHNQARKDTADAFLYDARLAVRAFDVEEERELPPGTSVRVFAPDAGATDGQSFFALRDDGVLLRFVGGKVEEEPAPKGYEPEKNLSGQYSRILLPTEEPGSLDFAVFPCVPGEDARFVQPRSWKEPAEGAQDWDRQVYSALRLESGQILLGLRNLEFPLAFWSERDRDVRPVPQSWGTTRHLHNRVEAGLCRVYSLADVWRSEVLAAGAQDGYLRLLTVEEDKITTLSDRSPRLGGPVRHMLRVRAGEGGCARDLLLVGTENAGLTSDLYGFEIPGEDPSQLRPVLRDLLRGPVVSLFLWGADHESPPRLCVLDGHGRITPFVLGGTERKGGEFQGQRLPQMTVLSLARAALHLGQGRVAVSGQRKDGREVVRVLQMRVRSTRRYEESRAAPALEANALAACQDFAGERAAELLASFPLGSGALRAALMDRRLGVAPTRARIEELFSQARQNPPRDRSALKSLLQQVHVRLCKGELSDRKALLKTVIEIFVGGAERRLRSNLEPRERALVARHLLTANTLRIVHDLGEDPWETALRKRIHQWVDDLLQDPDVLVPIEAARALMEALLEMIRLQRTAQAPPPLTDLFWLLDSLARYLYARPIAKVSAECDASTWAVVSVIVYLVRLVPSCALIIFDHLADRRVDPGLFRMLHERLSSGDDKDILQKLEIYQPRHWIGRAPSVPEIYEHCREAPDLLARLTQGQPDEACAEAWARCYERFSEMSQVRYPPEISALATVWARAKRNQRPDPPQWMEKLWTRRTAFYQFAWSWLSELPQRLPLTRPDELAMILGPDVDARVHGRMGSPLFEPEATVASVLLRHWQQVLTPSLPRQGDRFDPYTLGKPVEGSSFVFEALRTPREGEAPDRQHYMVATRPGLRFEERRELEETWEILQKLSKDPLSRIAPVVAVVTTNPSAPALVLQAVGHQTLAQRWDDLRTSLSPDARVETARRCCAQMGRALQRMHGSHLYHGDVRPENIIVGSDDLWFFLADFDMSGKVDGTRAGRSSGKVFYPGMADRMKGEGSLLQQQDAAALLQLIYQLTAKKKYNPRKFKGSNNEMMPKASSSSEWTSWLRSQWSELGEKGMSPGVDELTRQADLANPARHSALAGLTAFFRSRFVDPELRRWFGTHYGDLCDKLPGAVADYESVAKKAAELLIDPIFVHPPSRTGASAAALDLSAALLDIRPRRKVEIDELRLLIEGGLSHTFGPPSG